MLAKIPIGNDVISEINSEKESQPDDFDADPALLALLRVRDASTFEKFVRKFSGRMNAVARRILRCEADCADAVQESWLSAYRMIDKFEGNSALGTWLHRIVVNACLMKLRRRARESEVFIDGLLPEFDRSGHQRQAVRSWKHLNDAQLSNVDTQEFVRHCIDALPHDYRIVVILRDVEELTTDEAAEVLEVTPGTIKTRLHRARQALRTMLAPYFEE